MKTSTHLALLDLSACSESLDISVSLMASLTSSFSTVSIMRRRACARATKQQRGSVRRIFLQTEPDEGNERSDWPAWTEVLGCAVPALSDRDKCNALWDGWQLPKSPPLNTS